jgi:O-antigen/teichoic acid export membrane protein
MSIRKHTAYNLLGAVLPLALSLYTIPLYISSVGEARYGVLAVAWLLLGYFGLFDLGLGRATAQRIAAIGDSSSEQLASTFWTALTMNVSLGVVGGLIIWPVAIYFFGHFFSVEAVLRPELAAAIPWLVLAVPLATLSGVFTGAMEGRRKFLELNIISVSSSMLIQLVPLAVVWVHGPDLAWLLPAIILSRLGALTVLFFRCRLHVFKNFTPTFSRTQAKGLLQFGGWVTVSALISPMMVVLDRFVIGATLGAKAVTYYTVPFQLAERSTLLSGALTSALFPRLAATNTDEARKLATKAIGSLAVAMTPLILISVLLVEPFLRWWLTPEFASRAGLTAQILLLGFWINSFARVPYALLQAAGRPALIAKCHLAELIPYLLLLYIGLHYFGLPGAALVFGLRTFADCALLMWLAGILDTGIAILKIPVLLLLAGLGIAAALPAGCALWGFSIFVLLSLSLAWSCRTASDEIRNSLVHITGRTSHYKKRKIIFKGKKV